MDRQRDARDEQFAAYVRDRGEYLLRMAVLLTGDWHAAEDLVQASLGLVRRLDITQVSKVGADEFGTTVRLVFDDFGLPVSVAAPPLSQTCTGVSALWFVGWGFAAQSPQD